MEKITIYGTPPCAKCKTVKEYLDSNSIAYDYQEVGTDITHDQLNETVSRQVRAVPVIMHGNKEVDFDALKRMCA